MIPGLYLIFRQEGHRVAKKTSGVRGRAHFFLRPNLKGAKKVAMGGHEGARQVDAPRIHDFGRFS